MNRLAQTTGADPVPEAKRLRGYRFEPRKFEIAGLTPSAGEVVGAPLVRECPCFDGGEAFDDSGLFGEGKLDDARADPEDRIKSFEGCTWMSRSSAWRDSRNRVDPDKWRPLIMSFQEFYGLGEKVHASTLGTIPERLYRTPDIEEAARLAG